MSPSSWYCIAKLASSEQGEASGVLHKSPVNQGQLGGTSVLPYEGVPEHSVKLVVNILSVLRSAVVWCYYNLPVRQGIFPGCLQNLLSLLPVG